MKFVDIAVLSKIEQQAIHKSTQPYIWRLQNLNIFLL